jgi:3-oxoacyl-[acyl-carrier-protein] synthase-3
MGATIAGIEYYFPKKKLTNEDLAIDFPDYDFTKIETKVGIRTRYICEKDETGLDLAANAAEKLLTRFDKNEIDFILYCTQSPDYFLPTTACVLQNKLGLSKNIGALDFNLGCSGYVYGISMAKGLINSGQAKNILLITAETYSKFLHKKDRSNRAIFGDAATATLICHSAIDYTGEFLFGTDGSGFDKLIVKNGCSRFPIEANAEEITYGSDNIYTDNHLYMNGPEVFNFTNEVVPNFTREVLLKNKETITSINQFVFHQANQFMLDFMRKRLKIEKDKFYNDLADGGNTVSNTIPIALKKLSQKLDYSIPQKLLIVGFGVGLSWAGGLITLNNKL